MLVSSSLLYLGRACTYNPRQCVKRICVCVRVCAFAGACGVCPSRERRGAGEGVPPPRAVKRRVSVLRTRGRVPEDLIKSERTDNIHNTRAGKGSQLITRSGCCIYRRNSGFRQGQSSRLIETIKPVNVKGHLECQRRECIRALLPRFHYHKLSL